MPSVCIYFGVHQPLRLRAFTSRNRRHTGGYFDDETNAAVVQEAAKKCYRPANERVLRLIESSAGRFRVSYSISGLAIEQLQRWCPEAIASFQRLAQTGCVEFIGGTYYHSLAALYDLDEFDAQIAEHRNVIRDLFGQRPTSFLNTEFIYDGRIGQHLAAKGYSAVIAEASDECLHGRSPNCVFRIPGTRAALLLAHRRKHEAPPSEDSGVVTNLFMDYGLAGPGGVLELLQDFPDEILKRPGWSFQTPSQLVATTSRAADLVCTDAQPNGGSRVPPWSENRMQLRSLDALYALKCAVYGFGGRDALDTWRKLQTADHFVYMSTKRTGKDLAGPSGSPFESPYDAFVTYSNVVRDFADSLHANAASLMADARPEPLWFQPLVASYWPRRSYARPKFA